MDKNNISKSFLYRVFVLIPAILLFWGAYYLVAGLNGPLVFVTEKVGSPLLALLIVSLSFYVGVTLVALGLFLEAIAPSFDFRFNKQKKWLLASVILFSVSLFLNLWWLTVHGLPRWLPQYGWQVMLREWFLGDFATDTTIFGLVFGTLFLTASTPATSPSYKLMLIGVVVHSLLLFFLYFTSALGLETHDFRMLNFWGFTVLQPWFWADFITEIVTFVGAVALLRRSLNVKELILIVVFLLILFALLKPFSLLMVKKK